jgi:hypothetical protein
MMPKRRRVNVVPLTPMTSGTVVFSSAVRRVPAASVLAAVLRRRWVDWALLNV